MQKPTSSSLSEFPRVSVIAPCYNLERFVKPCLESIGAQDYPNLQIIVVDDCSKDASPRLIREWMEANPLLQVNFIQNKQNQGLCRVLNLALKIADGKYIARVDTDDVWEPGKIREQVLMMESLPEKVGVLYSDAYLIDENGAPMAKRFIESYRKLDHMPEGDIHEVMWTGNFIPNTTTMIRRAAFDKVGNYDEDLCYDDWDMWLRMTKEFHFAYFPQPTASYRILSTSMSHAGNDKMNLSNEIMFTKNLLQGSVPKSMRNQAINFAVRRIFRQKSDDFKAGGELLNRLIQLYGSPRLLYAWLLYHCGLAYGCYELPLHTAKKTNTFLKSLPVQINPH